MIRATDWFPSTSYHRSKEITMVINDYLKAAAKTVVAAIIGFLLSIGIEVDAGALEVVVTGLFVGAGSLILNLFTSWVTRFIPALGKFLPGYASE